MKRFTPWMKLVGFDLTQKATMRESVGGDYLKYEEVRDLIEYILNDCSLWETKPELLIKEWGEE